MRKLTLALVALVALVGGPGRAADAAKADKFFFKDGDVVVMIGDSITEQHLYSNYVEMWTVTRFPAWKLTFRNVGIGGDRSPRRQRPLQARRAALQADRHDRRFRHERRRLQRRSTRRASRPT